MLFQNDNSLLSCNYFNYDSSIIYSIPFTSNPANNFALVSILFSVLLSIYFEYLDKSILPLPIYAYSINLYTSNLSKFYIYIALTYPFFYLSKFYYTYSLLKPSLLSGFSRYSNNTFSSYTSYFY